MGLIIWRKRSSMISFASTNTITMGHFVWGTLRRTLLLFVSTSQYHQNNLQAEISEVLGLGSGFRGIHFASLASAGAPTLTEDQSSQLVDALVPVTQKMLTTKDADGNGMISAQCCTKM